MTGEEQPTASIPENQASILRIQEPSLQKPELPWTKYLENLRVRFQHWTYAENPNDYPPIMPNMPAEHQRIRGEIPSQQEFPALIRRNTTLRSLVGERTDGVFYRPGIGYGGFLEELLEKIGTYGVMISSDPVYEGQEMVSWSEGLLPVDYYLRTLRLLEPETLQVTITDDYINPQSHRVLDPSDYQTAELAAEGMASIQARINGVNLTVLLLAQDMTKFSPEKFKILGLGRPTPYNPDKAKDPRGNDVFVREAIQHLSVGGLIHYFPGDFNFFQPILPAEVFGFFIKQSDSRGILAQKNEEVGERVEMALHIAEGLEEALGVLAGSLPGENYMGYFENINQFSSDGRKVILDDVVRAYRERLQTARAFIDSLPNNTIRQKAVKRLEFLFMGPLATNRLLDQDKIMNIHNAPQDPDKPQSEQGQSSWAYFGEVGPLIHAHNSGQIDIFEYYQNLVETFYSVFPLESSTNL